MKAEQLDAIIELAVPDLRARYGELHPHILEAAAEALAASQDSETGGKPKVIISSKTEICLSTSPPSWLTKASVSVTYKSEGKPVILDDPDQPELAEDFGRGAKASKAARKFVEDVSDALGEGGSMTISGGGQFATIKGGKGK